MTLVATAGSGKMNSLAMGRGRAQAEGRFDIVARFPDGTMKQLTPGNGIYVQGSIHPDGRDVVFWGGDTGVCRLWRAGLENGLLQPLTSTEFDASAPAYAPDGKSILFRSSMGSGQTPLRIDEIQNPLVTQGRHFRIFAMDADGTNIRALTNAGFDDDRPSVHPDSNAFVFTSNRLSDATGLYRCAIGGNVAAIYNGARIGRPVFSADGSSIFCHIEVDGRDQLCRIGRHSQHTILAKCSTGRFSHGAFADFDGKTLLFHSDRDGSYAIWEYDLGTLKLQKFDLPGIDVAGHATRSRNRIMTFDAYRLG